MKTLLTKENQDDEHFVVDAIYKGYRVRITTDGKYFEDFPDYNVESEIREELKRELCKASPFPIYDYRVWVSNLVRLIESTPNSKVISHNEFEYAKGVYPGQF